MLLAQLIDIHVRTGSRNVKIVVSSLHLHVKLVFVCHCLLHMSCTNLFKTKYDIWPTVGTKPSFEPKLLYHEWGAIKLFIRRPLCWAFPGCQCVWALYNNNNNYNNNNDDKIIIMIMIMLMIMIVIMIIVIIMIIIIMLMMMMMMMIII